METTENLDRGDNYVEEATSATTTAAQPATEGQVAEDDAQTTQNTDGDVTEQTDEDLPRDEKGQFAPRIPKARFDEAVGKEREARVAAERRAAEAEKRLAAREQAVAQVAETSELESRVDSMETQYAKLLLDGKDEDAAKLRREIRTLERQIATTEATQRANQQISQTLEVERVQAAVAKLEAEYPTLNPSSEQYDNDLCDMILSYQNLLVTRDGLPPSAALVTAAEKFLKQKAAPAKEEPQKGLSAAQVTDDRKKAQVKKNIDTAAKQPPSTHEVGLDSDKAGATSATPDATKMSAEEFAALPEATKARMRGDYI
ncbi:hypothetical protein [Uliginosibacterium gangwonense]|uniref:hypothetical protein n=1 Tax=Uliginosibacterium gangwonense TaxID=392736 RepID=UPI00037E19AB|nr:hypothetical protein [Uliginosibacterium gangwonense]